MANKAELTKILVDTYGYTKEDLKDEKGKPLTNAMLQQMIDREESDAVIVQHEATAISVEDSVFQINDEDLIVVMSGEAGELIHRSERNGRMWRFTEYGQTNKMPFFELLNIYNNNQKCFEDCRLIILNDKVAENFNLTEIYKNLIKPADLDGVFEKDAETITETIKALPESMKIKFFSRARELFKEGTLDSNKRITAIEKAYGISLEDNAPLQETTVIEGTV